MEAIKQCPRAGQRVYGELLAFKCGRVLSRYGWGIVSHTRPSATEGLTNVFVDGEDAGDGLDWGSHCFWEDDTKSFPYPEDALKCSRLSASLDAYRDFLDKRREFLCQ